MAQISIRKKASGSVVGSGALVAPDTVLTCVHVLRDGGYARASAEAVTIEIDGVRCTATLLDTPWIGPGSPQFPQDRDLDEKLDFAILKLTSGSQQSPLLRRLSSELTETVTAFGFTETFPKGIEAAARARGVIQSRGIAQLDAVSSSHPIERGFSGSAVLDESRQVLGMVVTRWMPGDNDRHSPPTAYMIPIESIAERVRAHSLEFPDVAPSYSARFPQADEAVRAARQRRKPGAPPGDAARIVSESKTKPRWVYFRASREAGRSGFLDELLIECHRQDVVPFHVDLREAAAGQMRNIFFRDSFDAQLSALFDGCHALNGYANFEAAHRDGLRSMLVVDGIDEEADHSSDIFRLLEWVKANRGWCGIAAEGRVGSRSVAGPAGFSVLTGETGRPTSAADLKSVHLAIEDWAEFYDRKDQMTKLELFRFAWKDRVARPLALLVGGPSAEMHDAFHGRLRKTLPSWLRTPQQVFDYRLPLPEQIQKDPDTTGRLLLQRMCDCLEIESWTSGALPRGLIYFKAEISPCPKLDSRRAKVLRVLLDVLNGLPDLARTSALCVGISIAWDKSGPTHAALEREFSAEAFPNLRFHVLPNLRSPARDDAGEWVDTVHNRKPGGLTPLARRLLIESAERVFGSAPEMPMGVLLPELTALAK